MSAPSRFGHLVASLAAAVSLVAWSGVARAADAEQPAAPAEPNDPASRVQVPLSAWVLGGVGVVGLGSFAFFGWQGLGDQDQLKRDCAPNCTAAQVEPVSTKFTLANVSLIVGIVAVGAAVVVTIFSNRRGEPTTTSRLLRVGASGWEW